MSELLTGCGGIVLGFFLSTWIAISLNILKGMEHNYRRLPLVLDLIVVAGGVIGTGIWLCGLER